MGFGYFRERRLQGRTTLRQRAACALLALLAFLAPAQAWGQSDAVTAQSQAAILNAGQMVKLEDMDFGVIAQPAAAGTLTMVPGTSTTTCTGSAGILHTGACRPARFSVMEKRHERIRIREMNSGTVVLTGPGGATMTITNLSIAVIDMTFQSGGGPSGSFGRYRIESDSGIAEFRVGGRLNIGANQAAGSYSGTLIMNAVLN
jgi:spore coat protein U-like protein